MRKGCAGAHRFADLVHNLVAVYFYDVRNKSTFVDITAWNSVAEFIERNFKKDDQIYIEGELKNKPITVGEQSLQTNFVLVTNAKLKVYLSHDNDGNAVLKYIDGKPYAHKLALQNFSVAAFVTPTTGREYEESQKIRAETTYKISTRYFRNITPSMRILYNNREFEIVSVQLQALFCTDCYLRRVR